MAKKKFKFGLKVNLDSPVAIFFTGICILCFILDYFILKGKLTASLTSSPTNALGALPFEIKNPLSYLRIFFYAFGFESPAALITNLIFIMLLGPAIEERYGSIVIGIMMGVSVIFSGVLNSCFCSTSLKGCSSIIFMLIFLNSFMSITKKKIPLSFIFVIVLYIIKELLEKSFQLTAAEQTQTVEKSFEIIRILICIAGGLCGSLLAFLTSPKARAEKKYNKAANEIDSQSPRFSNKTYRKKNNDSDDDDDTTVVGTLRF